MLRSEELFIKLLEIYNNKCRNNKYACVYILSEFQKNEKQNSYKGIIFQVRVERSVIEGMVRQKLTSAKKAEK